MPASGVQAAPLSAVPAVVAAFARVKESRCWPSTTANAPTRPAPVASAYTPALVAVWNAPSVAAATTRSFRDTAIDVPAVVTANTSDAAQQAPDAVATVVVTPPTRFASTSWFADGFAYSTHRLSASWTRKATPTLSCATGRVNRTVPSDPAGSTATLRPDPADTR